MVLAVAWLVLLEGCRRRWRIAAVVMPWLVTIDLGIPVHIVTLTAHSVLRTVGRHPDNDGRRCVVVVHVRQDATGGRSLRLPAWTCPDVDVAVKPEPHAVTTLWLSYQGENLQVVST